MSACPDCVTCRECDAHVLCLSEPRYEWPCPHFEHLCGDCLHLCLKCRQAMEREMYRSGVYDPQADPFFLPEKTAEAEAYWASALREVSPGVFRYPEGDPS